MSRPPVPRTAATLAAALLATSLYGQSTTAAPVEAPVVKLEKVQITDVADAPDVAKVALAKEEVAKIPGAASVISSAELEKGRVATPEDLLAFQPGVFAQSAGGTDAIKISIRGSSLNSTPGYFRDGVQFLFDGMAITGPGGTPYELFETYGLNYTTVLRGANAFEFGSLAFGGAINFVSHTGLTSPGFTVRAEAGSFGWKKGQVSFGTASGPTDFYVSLVGSERDGFQDFSYARAKGISSNFGFKVSDKLNLRFFLRHRIQFNETPGAINLAELINTPEIANPANITGRSSSTKNGSTWLGARANYKPTPDSEIVAGLVYHNYPQILSINGLNPNYWVWKDVNASLTYALRSELAGRSNTFTTGLFFTYTPESGVNTYDLTPNTPWGPPGHLAKLARYNNSYDLVFNLGDELAITDKLVVSAGAGLSRIKRINEVRFNDRPLSSPFFTNKWNYWATNLAPRLGVRYEVAPETSVFSNVSRSIDPYSSWKPSGSGIANNYSKPLREQKGTTIEAGVKTAAKRLEGSLSVYRTWITRELLSEQIAPAVGTTPAIVSESNASPTIHQGVEAGFSAILWEETPNNPKDGRITVRNSFTYNDFHYRRDPNFGRNKLPGLPDYVYQADLQYQHRSGFYIGVNSTAASTFFVDYANTFKAPSYVIYGGRIGFDAFNGRWRLYADFRNLTDKSYATTTVPSRTANATSRVFYPGDGRGVFIGTELRF